jgi:ABC-type transport system substrate-binding protein
MPTIFSHALEGPPEDPTHFLGKTERDIRVRWLVANEASHGAHGTTLNGPWTKDRDDANGLYLKRSPNWPSNATGTIQEVHLLYRPNGNQVATQLMQGTIHFAPALTDPASFSALRSHPDVDVVAAGNISTYFLMFRLEERVNQMLRNRIASAIDVLALADLWSDAATPADALIHPSMHGHAWGKHGQVAPHGPGADLTLLCPPPNTFPHALAIDIQRQLGPTGIRVALSPNIGGHLTWKAMTDAWQAGTGDLLIAGWHQRQPRPDDPKQYLRALFHSNGGANWGRYNQVDGDLTHGRLKQAVDKVIEDVPAVPLVYWTRYSAYRKGKGVELQAGGLPKDRLVNVTL